MFQVIPISLCRTGGCGVGTRNDMLDGDSPNLDHFLPFSLRDVAIARALLNGKNRAGRHSPHMPSMYRYSECDDASNDWRRFE